MIMIMSRSYLQYVSGFRSYKALKLGRSKHPKAGARHFYSLNVKKGAVPETKWTRFRYNCNILREGGQNEIQYWFQTHFIV